MPDAVALNGNLRLRTGERILSICPRASTNIMDSSLRLASHLCAGSLVDQEHFFEWIVVSIHSSDLDNVPIWLLIVQIHWKDVVAFRRRGQRLAEALLSVLDKVSTVGLVRCISPVLIQIFRQRVKTLRKYILHLSNSSRSSSSPSSSRVQHAYYCLDHGRSTRPCLSIWL